MYTFIVNPHSRSKMGQVLWSQLESTLKVRNIEYQVHLTQYQKHATKIVRALTRDGKTHTIVALGGDGTINEVINGIYDFAKVTFGYIPTGSSNDFARSLGLPTDPMAALENILNPTHIRKMDIGTLSYGKKTRHFAVSAGIGFDAAVCHQAVVSKLKAFLNRIHLGKLTYVCIALSRILGDTPGPLTITLDNGLPQTFESAYFVSVMNHAYEGGGFKFCPKAVANDQMLDTIVIANLSKPLVLLLLPTAFLGLHTLSKKVHLFRSKTVSIESDKPLPVHTDGEPIFLQQRINAFCEPMQLNIITSK